MTNILIQMQPHDVGSKNHIKIYTDGSEKDSYGAWAYVTVRDDKVLSEASGREKKTQSLRMEFQAAIQALKSLPLNSKAILYSDCRILIDTMILWRFEWKKNGWIKSKGQNIPNVDLIIQLDSLTDLHHIEWKWIKAHSGITHNERCDELCIMARESR